MSSTPELASKLEELASIERRIESARPRNRAGRIFLGLLLLAVGISVAVAVSMGVDPRSALRADLVTVSLIGTTAAVVLPSRRLQALERRRDRLLGQIEQRAD